MHLLTTSLDLKLSVNNTLLFHAMSSIFFEVSFLQTKGQVSIIILFLHIHSDTMEKCYIEE